MQPYLARWLAQFIGGFPNFLTALLIFVVALIAARLLSTLIRDLLERRGTVNHVVDLLAHLVYWTIIVIGTITALQRFFDVTAFLTGLGIIGFTVGFALQDVMKNFAAGIILLLQQPFRVGEAINVAGFEGTILAVDLRATEMSTFDGRLVSIPNATVLTNPITNLTRAPRRRVDLSLQISPSADLEWTRKVVLDAIRAAPGVVSDPAPQVIVQDLTSTSLNLAASFWVDIVKERPELAKDAALTRLNADLEKHSMSLTGTGTPTAPTSPAGSNGTQHPSD